MDLQNCLNFQRELLYLPPTVTQWQRLQQRYRNASNPKKSACRKKKKKKKWEKKRKKTNHKGNINHTDKIKH